VLIEQNWIPVLTGLVVASCLGLGCWILGLALTTHPLLAKLQIAAREIVRLFLKHDLIG
jgi:hypothetical protein